MGLGRARDRALGLAAVRHGRCAVAVACCLLLGGCNSMSALIGIGAGAVAGGASANPAVGFAVGVGVAAASDYGIRYYGRTRQGAEQDAIAAAAGGLPPGGSATWQIRHTIPYGDEAGTLKVLRDIPNPLASCKEVVFSVVDGEGKDRTRAWYDADICRQGTQWKWASAEPAVARWGFLQ